MQCYRLLGLRSVGKCGEAAQVAEKMTGSESQRFSWTGYQKRRGAAKPGRPRQEPVLCATAVVRSSSIRPASSTVTAVNDRLCMSTPVTDHRDRLLQQWGATAERTDLNRGSSQAPIRSRSTVSGEGGGDTTLANEPFGRHAGMESAAADPSLLPHTRRHHYPPSLTSSSECPLRIRGAVREVHLAVHPLRPGDMAQLRPQEFEDAETTRWLGDSDYPVACSRTGRQSPGGGHCFTDDA